jgi:hypothetical protein
MTLNGKCHCGTIAFTLDWPEDQPDIPARACNCSFCVKHGGVWTSNPKAQLSVVVQDADLVSKYVFGTETAAFHVCSRCGTVPIVTSEIANRVYAVVNVNTFESLDPSRLRKGIANFGDEDVESRLARRRANWIADVRIFGLQGTGASDVAPGVHVSTSKEESR